MCLGPSNGVEDVDGPRVTACRTRTGLGLVRPKGRWGLSPRRALVVADHVGVGEHLQVGDEVVDIPALPHGALLSRSFAFGWSAFAPHPFAFVLQIDLVHRVRGVRAGLEVNDRLRRLVRVQHPGRTLRFDRAGERLAEVRAYDLARDPERVRDGLGPERLTLLRKLRLDGFDRHRVRVGCRCVRLVRLVRLIGHCPYLSFVGRTVRPCTYDCSTYGRVVRVRSCPEVILSVRSYAVRAYVRSIVFVRSHVSTLTRSTRGDIVTDGNPPPAAPRAGP
jgi:hypothetical protein